jgi:signal transduction histidine kinase
MQVRRRLEVGTEDAFPRRHQQPILAIDTGGSVTKANGAARKVFGIKNDSPGKPNLGAMLAGLILTRTNDIRHAQLSLISTSSRNDVTVVVSGEEAPAPAVKQETVAAQRSAPATASSPVVDFIAHELRNPIATISGFSQILGHRAGTIAAEDLASGLETIQSEADRALVILEALLRLAEARSHQLDTASVPLHAVMRRVIVRHNRSHPARRIACSGDTPVFASADPIWLELAVLNLLTNAEKYTPKDQQIEVAFRQIGSQTTISILDNGAALSPEFYKSLWDLYNRGLKRDAVVPGSGIGLALCKELVEGMGGHVWAGPRMTGGSAFTLSLPTRGDMNVANEMISPHGLRHADQASENAWI